METEGLFSGMTLQGQSRRLVCVGDTDSRLKWCRVVADSFKPHGFDCEFILFESGANPTPEQLAHEGIVSFRRMGDLAGIARAISEASPEVVLLGLGGNSYRVFQLHLFDEIEVRKATSRPILICGFPGVLYENRITGFLDRMGCDVICVNSEEDRVFARNLFGRFGIVEDPFVVTGLFMLEGQPAPIPLPPREPNTGRIVTFATQPSVPALYRERAYIMARLVDYAREHPEDTVLIKSRSPLNGRATHKEKFRYEHIRPPGAARLPPNMRFAYGRMKPVLDQTDILIAVSSTAAMQALYAGRCVVILADFGKKQRYGSHYFPDFNVKQHYGSQYFFDSGLMAAIDVLWSDKLPLPSPAWLDRTGLTYGRKLAVVVDRVESLLAQQAVQQRPLEPARKILAGESFGAFERWFASIRGPYRVARYRLGELGYFVRRILER
jgi:hypothetical protein